MTPNSLSPASIVIDYTSAFSPHKMTIPTKAWISTPLSGGLGSYLSWTGTTIDGEGMVDRLLAVLKVFFPSTTSFNRVTAYTQATPTSPNIPRASVVKAIAGTNVSTNPSAAVSATFNFKTVGNHNAKLVCLDVPFGSNWMAPLLPTSFSAEILALESEFTDNNEAWSGRDDERPEFLRTVTYDLNDKLQKAYFG